MKKYILGNILKFIKKNGNYNNDQLEIINYGLEGLYLTFSKLIIIFILAYLLNIIKEVIIFLLIYNVIRTFSFGLHATKSWICLLSSSLIFIGVPFLCKYIFINPIIKIFLGILLIILMYKNAPADTKKRPIINKKRRLFFKYISTIISIIFVFMSFILKNNFLINSFILSLVVQDLMISPSIYKLFNLPYNNYLTYLQNDI